MSYQKKFLRFNFLTIVSVYVLILVGGLVRSLGAGMGCPDWPKCFGEYIPPTSAAELPENYEAIFLQERLENNLRLANTLSTIGFDGLAERVRDDQDILKTEPFHATKAWVEYANRLVGVLIGIFVFFNMVFSWTQRNLSWLIPILGVSIFLLTGFQGWVGSLVVSTNLLPGFITFHMMLALLIVVLLVWMRVISKSEEKYKVDKWSKAIIGALFVLLIPQVITGTLTREQVDVILKSGIMRADLVAELSGSYFVHRSYSWLLLIVSIFAFIRLRRAGISNGAMTILMLVLAEFAIGITMIFGGMPVFLQPVHLVLATVLFGIVFYLFLQLKTVRS